VKVEREDLHHTVLERLHIVVGQEEVLVERQNGLEVQEERQRVVAGHTDQEEHLVGLHTRHVVADTVGDLEVGLEEVRRRAAVVGMEVAGRSPGIGPAGEGSRRNSCLGYGSERVGR
jgi:hypothetical protein